MTVPQQERSKLTAERILATAEEVLASAPYADFSMALVSSSSGLSIGGLYARFPNKEALLREVKNHVLTKLENDLEAALKTHAGDLPGTVSTFVQTLSTSLRRRQYLYAFIFTHSAGDAAMRQRGFAFHRRAKQLFTSSLMNDVAAGGTASTTKMNMAYEFIVQGLLMRVTSLGSVSATEFLYQGIPSSESYAEALTQATVLYLNTAPNDQLIGIGI